MTVQNRNIESMCGYFHVFTLNSVVQCRTTFFCFVLFDCFVLFLFDKKEADFVQITISFVKIFNFICKQIVLRSNPLLSNDFKATGFQKLYHVHIFCMFLQLNLQIVLKEKMGSQFSLQRFKTQLKTTPHENTLTITDRADLGWAAMADAFFQ